jgi:RNA polymerase sigma-70 factor (ECF subfamily)
VAAIVDAQQELEFFAEALRDLPARCRQIITLTKVYGLSEREVAERLGISEKYSPHAGRAGYGTLPKLSTQTRGESKSA